jgi:hypothetical protein
LIPQAKSHQTIIPFPKFSKAEKHELDLAFAQACYIDARPFTLYERGSQLRQAIQKLCTAYTPPDRKAISGPLLDETFDIVKAKMNPLLTRIERINVITDESTNINSKRIVNLSLNTKAHGIIHIKSEDIGSLSFTANNAAAWVREKLIDLTTNNLDRVNSVTTDTCSTMARMWIELRGYDDLHHIFTIPCDSHGIQLLIKDLVTKVPGFDEALKEAQAVAKAFVVSKLQLARLREYQMKHYNEERAFCLSVITRWGTQFRLLQSVLRNKDALRNYAREYTEADLTYDAHRYISSFNFWNRVEGLIEVLRPIDEALKMSESGSAGLGHVLTRWKTILAHLKNMETEYDSLQSFLSPGGIFFQRYERQVKDIHIVAFYLSPETLPKFHLSDSRIKFTNFSQNIRNLSIK